MVLTTVSIRMAQTGTDFVKMTDDDKFYGNGV